MSNVRPKDCVNSRRLAPHLHPIHWNTIIDRDSEKYIPCRRDGDDCKCIATCKRLLAT